MLVFNLNSLRSRKRWEKIVDNCCSTRATNHSHKRCNQKLEAATEVAATHRHLPNQIALYHMDSDGLEEGLVARMFCVGIQWPVGSAFVVRAARSEQRRFASCGGCDSVVVARVRGHLAFILWGDPYPAVGHVVEMINLRQQATMQVPNSKTESGSILLALTS